MGVCLLGNQCRLKSSSSILRNSQVVLQGTEQVARSQSEKPLTSSEGSVTDSDNPCGAKQRVGGGKPRRRGVRMNVVETRVRRLAEFTNHQLLWLLIGSYVL